MLREENFVIIKSPTKLCAAYMTFSSREFFCFSSFMAEQLFPD